MKIIFVSHSSSSTDIPKFIFGLANSFAVNHQVTLVTKRDGILLQQAIQENSSGINYLNVNNHHEVFQAAFAQKVETAIKVIKQQEPDLVYVNSVASSEWVVASRLCGIKNIFHIHEMKSECMELLMSQAATPDVLNYTDLVIYGSQAVERDVRDFFDSQPPASTVQNYFFDCPKILDLSNLEQPLPQNAQGQVMEKQKPVVCAWGIASHSKGVDLFFETAQRLPHLQFLWIGQWYSTDGSYNPVEHIFQKEKLDNFFITGEVDNPYFYLNLADLFVLSSREDNRLLTVIETLILGKQAVCFSKTGGARFILDRYGYVISGEPNLDLLVQFIKRLFPESDGSISIPEWLTTMEQKILKMYNKESVLLNYQQIINDSLQKA